MQCGYQESITVASKAFEYQSFADVSWYNYGARFYDPQLGRWHVTDPISEGFYSESPYSYVYNNPVNYIDPYGLYPAWYNPGGEENSNYYPEYEWPSYEGDIEPPFGSTIGSNIGRASYTDHVVVDVYTVYKENGKWYFGQYSYTKVVPVTYTRGGFYIPGSYNSVSNGGSQGGGSFLPVFPNRGDQVLDPVKSIPGKIWYTLEPKKWSDGNFTWEVDINGKITGLAPMAGLGTAGLIAGPSAAKLFRSALGIYKNTRLTNVGRALTKHPDVMGFNDFNSLTQSLRNPMAVNQAGANALKGIMRNGTRSIEYMPTLGENVIQYTLPSGYGARWRLTGEWVTFITP